MRQVARALVPHPDICRDVFRFGSGRRCPHQVTKRRASQVKRFQIFQKGKHVDSSGKALTMSDADLVATAEAYDPAVHEAPIVIGHPKDNKPAFGWIGGVTVENGALYATPREVHPSFSEWVKNKLYKKRSASFYLPDAPGNPVPGTYSLRHVAFLGAQPPAVKGMEEIEFADDEEGTVTIEFGEEEDLRTMSWAVSSIGRLAQAFRDFLVSERGEEEANKAIDGWEISNIFSDAGRLSAKADEASKASSTFSEPVRKEISVGKTQAEIDAEAAALEEQKSDLDKRQADFAEEQKAADRKENERELQALADGGRFAPGLIPEALDFMDGLDKVESVEFGEGDSAVKTNRRDWFLDLLKKSGTVINFSEVSAEEGDAAQTVDFAAPDGATVDPTRLELHNKAVAYQASHPNTTYEAALAAVGVR